MSRTPGARGPGRPRKTPTTEEEEDAIAEAEKKAKEDAAKKGLNGEAKNKFVNKVVQRIKNKYSSRRYYSEKTTDLQAFRKKKRVT